MVDRMVAPSPDPGELAPMGRRGQSGRRSMLPPDVDSRYEAGSSGLARPGEAHASAGSA